MRVLQLTTLVAIFNVAVGFNLFGSSSSSNTPSNDVAAPTVPSEPPHSLSNKPELYNKAMLELKRLEDEPLCHRLAAQLLINTCRGLQNVNEENLQFTKSRLQRNHVESFAAALTICDMEDVKMAVPEACRPLSSSALFQAVRDNMDTLVVPADVVGACLTSLSEQEKPWMTWLSRRDTALLFCRASSIDMDNDQLFQSHKKLVQIMADFSVGLNQELKDMMANMEARAHEADSYFEGFKNQMDHMKSKAQASFEAVSIDIKDVASSIKSIKQSGTDMQQFLQGLFRTAVEGNAEMAATHEQALSLSTTNIQNQFQGLHEIAERNQEYAVYMAGFMDNLLSRMEAASEHHEAMAKNAQQMTTVLANATELFLVHAGKIEQASLTVSQIHENLGPIAAVGDVVFGFLKHSGYFGDWAIRVATPTGMVWLGGWGLPASMIRNALLGIGGLSVGEVIVRVRHLEWSMEQYSQYLTPYVFTQRRQHPRQSKFDTPTEDPNNTATEDFIIEDIHFEMS